MVCIPKIVLFLVIIGTTGILAAPSSSKDITPLLVDLGEVDGKSYAYHLDGGLTWYQARSYCRDQRMELATITSLAQQDFLKSKASLGEFLGEFWTAGKDVLTLDQFSWDGSNAPLINYGQEMGFNTFFSCVFYTASTVEVENGKWGSWHCAVTAVNGVLCQG